MWWSEQTIDRRMTRLERATAFRRSDSVLILTIRVDWPGCTGVVDCDPHYKYGVRHHLEGLPPLCVLHGNADELSPFSQSVELAEELERRGMPYEFYGYDGLSHYFAQTADDATTQQMFQDSVDCLRRWLEDN